MEGSPQREVVLEIEHVKVIRKRAKTRLKKCHECREVTDFILITGAAELFSTPPAELFEFCQTQVCHYLVEKDEIFLCLTDLLTAMRKRMSKGRVRLLGEKL
jgi:hypothetical protein